MGILQYPSVLPSQVGVIGAAKYMVSTDSLATITTAGYLNKPDMAVFPISASDLLGITYNYDQQTGSGSFTWSTVTIVNGVITVVVSVSPGNVLLPVVSGNYASFNGTTGQIKDSGQAPSNAASPFAVTSPGSLTIGNFPSLADAKGTLAGGLPPSAASQAYVVVSPGSLTSGNFPKISDVNGTLASGLPPSATGNAFVPVSPGSMTIGHLLSAGDANGTLADSGVVAANVVQSSLTNPDAPSDLIWNDVTCTFTALASAGQVTVQLSSGAKSYIVRDIRINYTVAGLSGGGGDRLLIVTDGTTTWNDTGITAALLGTPVNTLWGGSGNPVAGTVALNTASTPGVTLRAEYAGGTTDYTAGSVIISVLTQRVA